MTYKIHVGDCLAVLRSMADNSVDAIVTDPPYGLTANKKGGTGVASVNLDSPYGRARIGTGNGAGGFMGHKWDSDVPSVEIWAECLRVLKPGGHMLAFAGTRTQHRMAVRIEDAGFEIRDMIAWVYGSGFPKSRNISADMEESYNAAVWQGWGTALKPALEPITVARKPLGTCATNVLQMVESQLRERGVRGEILWKPESASGAARSKKTISSGSIRPSERSATSAKTADESVTPSAEQQSLKSSEQLGTSGLKQTQGASESFQGCTTSGCGNPSSAPTEGSARAAESVSATSSPSTTSTAAEPSTASKFTGRCTPNCAETVSRPDTESFAGIATGLTGSMETVRISRDSEGFFLWPKGLPEFVPGSPLTVAANVLAHGTGALNIDACRVGWPDGKPPEIGTPGWGGPAKTLTVVPGQEGATVDRSEPNDLGRWPANIIHDGSDEVLAAFPQAPGQMAKASTSSTQRAGQNAYGVMARGSNGKEPRGDAGSAARFFYCAKASRSDRNEGLPSSDKPAVATGATMREQEDADWPKRNGNHHPTVKPTELMAYLVRLVTPAGGVVLDPFMGSGSTGKACMREGFQFIGCDLSADYAAIAKARIEHELRKLAPSSETQQPGETLPLFEAEAA